MGCCIRAQELMTGTKKAEEGVQKGALFIKLGGQISHFQYSLFAEAFISLYPKSNSLGLLPDVQVIAGDNFSKCLIPM